MRKLPIVSGVESFGKTRQKRGIMESNIRKYIFCKILAAVILCLAGMCVPALTAEAGLRENPFVTFSPDGQAFTTNADEKDTEWYKRGYTVYTGRTSALRDIKTGEHYYAAIKSTNVAIGKWMVDFERGRCIHSKYLDTYFHGVQFSREVCYREYYSGWAAYCADCGQKVTDFHTYMSDEAAAAIDELDMTLGYYYRCPWCTKLEMGVELTQHVCQDISANQYSVRYHANFGNGYMPKSVHMYNNATMYEGNVVTPEQNLTLNSFTRVGYEFVGWNTKSDGSGQSFTDGQEIFNLCIGEQESIILYAQWKKSRSILEIDPAGGRYNGSSDIYRVSGLYGSSYRLNTGNIEAPKGATVQFDTNGGTAMKDITGKMEFAEWSMSQPVNGGLDGNIYSFKGKDGSVDRVTAIYKRKSIILPEASRPGYSFGGWYYDKEATKLAGVAGEEFLPSKDTTLYAYWVELQLTSKDNYTANGEKGAVDLSWSQKDNKSKTYLIYQRRDDTAWEIIHSANEISTEKSISKDIDYSGKEGSYAIPYTGYYRLTLTGAQGGNYQTFKGGKGGQVSAVIYFRKGEVLKYNIGGQNGYLGGGKGSVYGNGGGYTSVSTQAEGTLLIAGGGGGAAFPENGHSGGSLRGTIAGSDGQNGMAGGGGGYRGGTSGSAVRHNHVDSCRHVHVGNSSVYGGCYTVKQVCGNTSFNKVKYKEVFYYGNIANDGSRIFCVRCGSYECPGHRDEYYNYRCTVCNAEYKDYKPASCTSSERYGLGCGMSANYICGYSEGQVIGVTAANGGSNYIKESACLTYEEKAGVRQGHGTLLIEAVHIGYMEENYLNGVKASDLATPDKISMDTVEIKAVDAGKVNVSFDKPSDNGTIYYHMAESYNRSANQKLSTSNQTANTLTSGVYSYRYCMDTNKYTTVTKQAKQYIYPGENPYISVTVGDEARYLHIAAEDKAGNLSETIHIPISTREIIFWPIITGKILLRESENVYNAGDVYYVKADGTTSFSTTFNSRLCGTALKDYQINQLHFLAENMTAGQEEGTLKVLTPMESAVAAGTSIYRSEELQKQYEKAFCLTDASFTEIRRSDYCKKMEITQAFILNDNMDGQKIRLTPQAGVITEKADVMSDRRSDMENSVYLIADGSAPTISGLDIPKEVTDTQDGNWSYTLRIEAKDTGSGVKEFQVEIRNTDNGGLEVIEDADKDGVISLELSSKHSMFWGKFSIIALAKDNVGNESADTYGMDGITVDAYIEKMLEPQTNTYKRGESGILHIQTTGYIERVEVTFPKEWSGLESTLNKSFIYDIPDFLQTEEAEFMVPLQVPDGKYIIVVKAYKADRTAEAKPELLTITVSGSVLDEFRRRLR